MRNAVEILESDPQNRSGNHAIRKLENVDVGEGQYRLRLAGGAFVTTWSRKTWSYTTAV